MSSERIETFEALLTRVERFRDDRDWAQFHTLKNLTAAIAVEAGELQELFLWSDDDDLPDDLRRRLEAEVADVIIHCANLASAAGIDLPTAVARKLDENAAKYPVHKARGNATKYTDM